MVTPRKQILAIILAIVLAGCGGMAGIGGPSVSNAEATVIEGQPAVVFDYEIDDYATVMLENPDGYVVHERRIEPEHNSSALLMGETQGGEYQLLIRQGGETVASETLEYDGPSLAISSIDDRWSGNSLESVSVTIENTGDLPARLEDGSFEVHGSEVKAHYYEPIAAGESKTVVLSHSFGGITFEKPGPVEGTATVKTTDGDLSEDFSRVLEPASLTVEVVGPHWSGNELEQIDVSVRNTGDVPTIANITVEHEGEVIAATGDRTIDPDGITEFEARPTWSGYQVESGGEAEFDVYANSPSGRVTDDFTQEIDGADVSIESIVSTWEHGQLKAVQFTANNAGDVGAEYDATIKINGEKVSEEQITIPPEGVSDQTLVEDSIYTSLNYVADSGGEYDVTLTIETEDGSISATDTVGFEGLDTLISDVDTTFYNVYDSSESELASVRFDVRNQGDILLRYDSMEVEIDGITRTDSPYWDKEIQPGSSTSEYVSIYDNIVVDSGTHDLTIRLLLNGDIVTSETIAVSTE